MPEYTPLLILFLVAGAVTLASVVIDVVRAVRRRLRKRRPPYRELDCGPEWPEQWGDDA